MKEDMEKETLASGFNGFEPDKSIKDMATLLNMLFNAELSGLKERMSHIEGKIELLEKMLMDRG